MYGVFILYLILVKALRKPRASASNIQFENMSKHKMLKGHGAMTNIEMRQVCIHVFVVV